MRLKIGTKIGSRYVYSQAWIEEWQLEHILNYISSIQDIELYYQLCRAKTFKLNELVVDPIGTGGKLQTYNKRVFTGHSTVIFMDRNINYKTYSPFTLFVNGNIEKALPGYHAVEYENNLKEARKVLA